MVAIMVKYSAPVCRVAWCWDDCNRSPFLGGCFASHCRNVDMLACQGDTRKDAIVELQATQRERMRLAANRHDSVLIPMTGPADQIEACKSEALQ